HFGPVDDTLPDQQVEVLKPDETLEPVTVEVHAELHEEIGDGQRTGDLVAEGDRLGAFPDFVHAHGFETDLQMVAVDLDDRARIGVSHDALNEPVAMMEPPVVWLVCVLFDVAALPE